MKIVQSLWSKPALAGPQAHRCGWPDKRYNYFSWAFSVLQFKKYYNEVELVTDQAGYDLLIDKMKLPYTNVRVVLDRLDGYHKDLYAIGKLYAYSIQDGPFIHADGDVFIWEKFSHGLESSGLICQNKEQGEDYSRLYYNIYLEMLRYFHFCPSALERSIHRNGTIIAVNAGILGGQQWGFFKDYAAAAFEFIDKNAGCLHQVDLRVANIVFEQFLFHALAEEKGIPVGCFNPQFISFWNDIADYTGVPCRTKYIHTIGALKKEKHIAHSLEYRLQHDYPRYYYHILDLIHTHQI